MEIIREHRDLPPAHYIFKIENFSLLSNAKVEKFQSAEFEVGGYKWNLCLYPKGNKKRNANGSISLYLVLSKSNDFTFKEINVNFKLFVYNYIEDKYLTIQDAKVKRFRRDKSEWGFDVLVSLADFNDASNGYLMDDCCTFGAEIFVIENANEVTNEFESCSDNNWGYPEFMSLKDLNDKSKGFIVDNTVIVEVQFLMITLRKSLS